jgi:ABC-2 type transport system permease protein
MTVEQRPVLATSATVAAVATRPHSGMQALNGTLHAVYVIWYRDLLRFWRDRVRLLASFAQPLLFLLVFGVGLSSSLSGASSGFGGGSQGQVDYAQFVYPGAAGMAVLFSSMFSAMSIVWDREFGFLKEILVAPISRSAVAVGKTLGGATQAMIQGIVMLAFAPLVGVHLSVLTILKLIPLFFVLAFGLAALGVALAARMRSMQGFQVVMNFMMMPMFFLSGALFPLDRLPAWMTVLTRIDPVAYGISPIRTTVLSNLDLPSSAAGIGAISLFGRTLPVLLEVAMLIGFGFLMLGLAIRGFRVRD